MLVDQSESDQLAAIHALDAKLRAKRRKQRENKKSKKKMKGLELDAKCLSGPNKPPDDSDLTGHVDFVALPDTSGIVLQKDNGTDNINARSLVIQVPSRDGAKVVEGYNNGKRDITCVKSNNGINGGNYVHGTNTEEFKMIAELGMCSQLSAMVSPEARMKNAKRNEKKREKLVVAPTMNEGLKGDNLSLNSVCGAKVEDYKMLEDQIEKDQLAAMHAIDDKMREKNRKVRENKKSKKKLKDLEPDAKILSGLDMTAEGKRSTHVINVALPYTSEAHSGDCSKIVKEYENGGKTNKGVRSDSSINRHNYVYRTKAKDYKMISELGISPQLSAMVASGDRVKKRAKRNDKGLEKTQQLTNYPPDVKQPSEVQKKNCVGVVEVTNGDGVRPDIGVYKYRTKAEEYRMLADMTNCSQDVAVFACEAATMDYRESNTNKGMEENQNSAVACVADEQRGNILKALETTKEINTSDVLRAALVIDPGLSFSEGHKETPCLENPGGNSEIEQTEAPVREEEEVFDRRDGVGDIAAEIVKHEDSTKAADIVSTLKLGLMKKEDNFLLRKRLRKLRKPRYYDFPDRSLQMCHNCVEDDHKAAECTMVRKKKPCYICGGFRHTAKRCNQGRECFKCGGRGHLARDCLEKPLSNNILDFCLRCGDSGHHMFICQSDYSSEDLKAIQCYVCKEFGHLCCGGFKYEGQTVASCYKCGQSGHLGSTGQCTHESTAIGRSFSVKEIIPNFAHAPS